MRTMRRSLAPLGVLLFVGSSALWGQHPHVRKGFWIGFGIGYGSAQVSCDNCGSSSREGSFTGHVRLGGTLRPNLLLGADITGWSKSENGSTVSLGNLTATAIYYPVTTSGFFFKGGAGVATFTGVFSGLLSATADGAGFGFTVGVGYDVRVGRNVSLTPVGSFVFGSVGDIQNSGTVVRTGWKQNFFEFGLDVTFH